jgi:hypothetical protein
MIDHLCESLGITLRRYDDGWFRFEKGDRVTPKAHVDDLRVHSEAVRMLALMVQEVLGTEGSVSS